MKIIEIEPFSKEYIKQFLSSNKILERETDIEKYQQLFDGNMKTIFAFAESKKTLEGNFFFSFHTHLKKDWVELEKESILLKLMALSNKKNMEGIDKILKSIFEKKNQTTGWTILENIENKEKFEECRKVLLENNLIIQRREAEYKLKNGLTEEIIKNINNK